jgi:hypothetical protein
MNNAEFQKVVDRRKRLIDEVLTLKADEYARGDRLSNFKVAAELTCELPIEVLAGLMVKHEVAFHNFVNDWGLNEIVQSYARWDEKIGDMINYLILADAIIREYMADNEMELPE